MADDGENENHDQEASRRDVFFTACLNAWIETRMEKDRQVLTLSSLAIGLLMVFHDKLETSAQFSLWLGAALLFLACAILVLMIFSQNADYLEVAHAYDEKAKTKEGMLKKSLKIKTCLVNFCFISGIIMTLSLAVVKTDFVIQKVETQKEKTQDVKK